MSPIYRVKDIELYSTVPERLDVPLKRFFDIRLHPVFIARLERLEQISASHGVDYRH